MSSEAYRTMYRMLDMARMDARREGAQWQKEQSQEIIDRMASDNARMASDMKRMNSDNERIIASMRAEIEALKAASSRPSAR